MYLRSQKGFTLPEIMISMGLLAGVGLITMKLMSDQSNNQAFLKTSADISGAVSKIESYLSNPVTCKAMLGGKLVPATSGASQAVGVSGTVEASVLNYTRPQGGVVNVLGEANYGNFSIPDNGIKLEGSAFGQTVAEMVITFRIENKSFLARGKNDITKRIQFVVKKDAGNLIENCGPVLKDSEAAAKKKMCLSLGGAATWSDVAGTCTLRSVSCPHGQVATRLTSLGGIICEPLIPKLNMSDLFDTTPSACGANPNYQIVSQGGKFRIRCN